MASFFPLSLAGSQSSEPASLKSIFFVSNVHCASCVAYIEEVLSEISSVSHIDVSIFTHEVRVHHSPATEAQELASRLIQAAFEVHHVTTYDSKGDIIADFETTSWLSRSSMFLSSRGSCSVPLSENKLHIANCDACRKEGHYESPRVSAGNEKDARFTCKGLSLGPNVMHESDTESLVQHPPSISEEKSPLPKQSPEEFNAVISIEGMSCSSCVNAITAEVQDLDFVKDVAVSLITNSATLAYTGPRSNIESIIECIEDIGFEASIDQVNDNSPTSSPEGYVAELMIGGMTCGSCVGTVTHALEELSFVIKASVNLMSSSGRVEFKSKDNIGDILEKIEDLGYDASLSSIQPLGAGSDDSSTTRSRSVLIRVDGMFCHHCPGKVVDSLKDVPGVEVEETLSVKHPILKLTYIPSPSLTIRNILSTLNAAHDSFTANVYHPPTIEDRSRAIQKHERRRLLSRLLFVFIVTIPTFLIGIVFMSLVSSDNKTRKFFEQPVWIGSVSRTEWAMFIMTTPVMVYGTDVFHVRALKEIYTLWRPGSRVPILRRLYRFGSMNLLISAGTSVAYFSSVAVLIIDAVVGTPSSTHSSTYFDSVIFLTLFILAGRFLEAYSKAKTGDAVSSLGKLRPSEALLVDNQSPENQNGSDSEVNVRRINVDLLEIGDAVRIPHGASPPADGVITGAGSYQFDESSLTGESKPVKKSAGDSVYTGSVNVGQPVQINLSDLGGSSMLDRIIAVVREGQNKRAPLERVADVLTSHFVPAITLIAISTFVIWLALGHSGVLPADYLDVAHGGWTFWALQFAISVFVVACPCGLALAAPTALFVGGGLAARNGILVKGGGEAFQEASRLNAIVFDKTGTLTEGGSLKVSDHETLSKNPELHQIAWAVARELEESSNHPMARAIMEFCSDKDSASILSSDIHEIPGHGMKGSFTLSTGISESDQPVQYEAAIGNERLLHQLIPPDTDTYYLSTLLSKYQSTGKSTAILAIRKTNTESPDSSFSPALVFATSDLIRPEAVEVISKLRDRDVDVYMCTGDNQTTAQAVADMLGIPRPNVRANVMPAEKATFVRQVQESTPSNSPQSTKQSTDSRRIVAFVGDGVNDSPALAAADVSIAMATGSDVAINSASFILLNSDLDTILQLVLLSRRVFNRVRMNFGWAVVYNLTLVPIAAGVLYPIVNGHKKEVVGGEVVMVDTHWRLSPVWAALAMALSSISVICSSLALGVEGRVLRRFRLNE